MDKIRFIIVGSGWRSLFYVRIAKYLSESFECCAMLCRSKEKADKIRNEQGIYTTVSAEECIDFKPDFAVVAVSKQDILKVSKEWLERGVPVLCETPLGSSEEEIIEAYGLYKKGHKIQVAEQYHRYPFYSTLIDICNSDLIGEPYNITLSTVHDYHAASLIRKILRKEGETVKIYGKGYKFPVIDTMSRYEAYFDGRTYDRERAKLTFEYDDGKTAFYDFQGIQYRSTIRKKFMNIQGVRGEVMNRIFYYLDNMYKPHETPLLIEGNHNSIQKITFEGKTLYNNPFNILMPQDETAIALVMKDMKTFIDTGKEGYSIKQALTDSLYSVKMHEALENAGRVFTFTPNDIFIS